MKELTGKYYFKQTIFGLILVVEYFERVEYKKGWKKANQKDLTYLNIDISIKQIFMYRPQFIEKENMKLLGFDLMSDKDGYLKYQNDGTKHYNKDYNPNFAESKGKVIISINTDYNGEAFYLGIKQDAGTRTCYAGICDNEAFLKLLIKNIR